MITNSTVANPRLCGVHHTARPTWKLEETVEFYRDRMGLKLVHAISAKGWGAEGHPDFLHFFFESGRPSTPPDYDAGVMQVLELLALQFRISVRQFESTDQ